MAGPKRKQTAQIDSSTQQRILAAARVEFARRGIDGARTQVIAQRAKANKALLHYYFRSKERLYEAVITDMMQTVLGRLRQSIAKAPANIDPRILIHSIVSAYIHTLEANPDFPPMLIRELIDGGKRIPSIIDGLFLSFGDVPARILEIIQTGIRNGSIRPFEPLQVIMNIMTMTVGTFVFAPFAAAVNRKIFSAELVLNSAFYERRIKAITDMTCDGLFAGRRES